MSRHLSIQTSVPSDPYNAMNVRCAKIDPANSTVYGRNQNIFVENKSPELGIKTASNILFPNPTSDLLYIDNNSDVIFFELYDMSGKLIRLGEFKDNKISIELIPKGVYLIKIINKTKNETFTKKIIKQ